MVNKTNTSGRKRAFFAIFALLVVLAATAYWFRGHAGNAVPTVQSTAAHGTPSKPTPHQTVPSPALPQGGGVVDNQGQAPTSLPDQSLWLTSASGNITLQQPYNNDILSSGAPISGLAKVNDVQFILTDNRVGLIAQGNLTVVNGRFSGTLKFTAHSQHGKLEVYSPNPQTGAEENIISAQVNFGS